MKKLISGLVSLFISFGCIAQEKLPTEKLIEDYDIFQSIFEKANAGLYKYHLKKEIDSAFSTNRKLINNKTTYREFYNIIWNVIDYTGSSHNRLTYPDSFDKALSKQKIFFPIPLKYLNGKLYSISDSVQIPLGSEILSVNKINAEQFSKGVSKYMSTDGHNLTGKYAFLETDWLPFYVYLAYGEQTDFIIEYKKDNIVKTATLKAVDYKTTIINYKKRFVSTYEKENQQEYSFKYLSNKTGLLNVNTFALGGAKSEGHKKYASFLDSVFVELKNRNIENLIVDVRQNGGGNDPNDLILYSYLTKRNFRENLSAFTLFNSVPLKQYFVEEEKDEIRDLEKELKEEHSIFKNGEFYQNDTFNKVWQPNPNAFKGKVYLLISPFVASAGSLFASMVKSDDNSVVIGEETLGGYYGHTGHIPITYRLPNSGLLITFSIVDLEQDVQELPDQKYGDGVKPDYKIEPTIKDYIKGKDVVLDFAKQLTEK
ncbi:peptidase S41 [Flavobacterium sp. Sd200]|uniref:S41 family peptidase n=1 Tax=Flavobacterium sp. Sd200 TaxID=2692211 RepID=UPI001369A146|nr:S41 family peptidase [Flavobacterium sp. Sd200]MXN93247.1 peptidase S41 [Flavobacterium sp. Sd200]